jgi:predicted nucleic acid-binding protein
LPSQNLGLVNLLARLYDTVLIPTTVYEEVVTRGLEMGESDAYAVQLAVARRELQVTRDEAPSDEVPRDQVAPDTPAEEGGSLHDGEIAAIRLAGQEQADWLLLDDQLAREQAQGMGLRVKGTLGVIVEAGRREFLSREEMDIVFQAILDRDDIWISDALVRRVWTAWSAESAKS